MGINLLNSEDLGENKFGEDFMLFLFWPHALKRDIFLLLEIHLKFIFQSSEIWALVKLILTDQKDKYTFPLLSELCVPFAHITTKI